MAITSQSYVGIDVSKDKLDVAVLGKKAIEQFANTKYAALCAALLDAP